MEEAAVSLGYSPFQAFMKVTVPLIVPGIVAGAMLSFVTAINELSSSLVLYVGSTMTMPVRIYLLILDGDFGTAAAMSSILLALSGAAIYLAFRFLGRNEQALL
jgi:iron(III) transport system permease protein